MFGVITRSGMIAITVTFALACHGVDDESVLDGEFIRAQNPVPGKYIVVMDPPGTAPGSLETGASQVALTTDLARAHGVSITRMYEHGVHAFAAHMDEAKAIALSRDPGVKYVQEVREFKANATQSQAPWGLDRIDQRSLPLSDTYAYGPSASNVHVFIADTGIRDTHVDFADRALRAFDAINDPDTELAEDCNGHGTHVSGTAGGTTYGVAKGVRLYGVKVLNCEGSGDTETVLAGLDYVIDQVKNHGKSPAIINMSLGGEPDPAIDDKVRAAVATGITVVVAAGNEEQDACNVSPARVREAITVGATRLPLVGNQDSRSGFSNTGSCVDIFAPGSLITSAWSDSDTSTLRISGTSMASPHVAGAAALYLSQNTGALPDKVKSELKANATRDKIADIGTGSPNELLYTGFISGGDTTPPAGQDRTAAYDSGYRTPRCSGAARSCTAAPELIRGRGPVGPESNHPNTLASSCSDASSGIYQSTAESIERLRIETSSPSLAAGHDATVDVSVWAYSSADRIDLFYAASADNPVWQRVDTQYAPGAGEHSFTFNYTLPEGSRQAIRAQIRYFGSDAACSSSSFADRDDLVFDVQ